MKIKFFNRKDKAQDCVTEPLESSIEKRDKVKTKDRVKKKLFKKYSGFKSIKNQLLIIYLTIFAGSIFLCWLLNNFFLEKYYIKQKETIMIEAYEALNEATLNESTDSDSFSDSMKRLNGIYNVEVVVIDSQSKLVTYSGYDSEKLMDDLRDRVFVADRFQTKLIDETDNYIIELSKAPERDMTHLEMFGTLDNGDTFMIRSVVESIQDSVRIANRFLIYISLITAIIAAIIITYVTKRISKPIKDLTDLSVRMSDLDFNVHYNGQDKNEIGQLGHCMNQLSDSLQQTIGELKQANNELQKDIEKREQIDEMRKEFISNVSHEFKTPIALILGYAEGLKDNINQDDESREFYCDVISDEAQRMNKMVKNLLELNQLEFGYDSTTMELFDVVELINNCVQSSKILLENQNITLDFKYDGPVLVWSDEFKIEEVFRNYLSNAIHHVDGDNIIKIDIKNMESKVHISVFNTGNHIPEESLPYLFDKFYKVDKARTREYGGSGIGLSIVKAVMNNIHEDFGVQNVEGGVEFWFELPTK